MRQPADISGRLPDLPGLRIYEVLEGVQRGNAPLQVIWVFPQPLKSPKTGGFRGL